ERQMASPRFSNDRIHTRQRWCFPESANVSTLTEGCADNTPGGLRIPNQQKEAHMKSAVLSMNVIALVLALSGPAAANPPKVQERFVEYGAPGHVMKGYLAYDGNIKGKRPGVMVVHEWWGLNDYTRKRARMLAELGYTALAVDMYGEGKQAEHPEDAAKLSSGVMKNFDGAVARFTAALDYLKQQPTVDPQHIAAIGYCFGGGIVLNMARQ